MKTKSRLCLSVFAAALAFGAGAAEAHSTAGTNEYSAQLKMDKTALQREERQLRADEAKLKADKAAGRMAAESPDSLKVYKDRQYLKGERKDIAADESRLQGAKKN